jgi:hypothetical protein
MRQYIPPKHRKTYKGLHGVASEYSTVHSHFCENLKFKMFIVIFLIYLEGPKEFMDQRLVTRPSVISANVLNMEVKSKVVPVFNKFNTMP